MSELYRINKRGDAFLHPDAAKLTKHLKKIPTKHFLFIVRAYDYHGPLHQYAKKQRIAKAKQMTFESESYDPMQQEFMEEAIDEYLSLQYDQKRETIDVLKSKMVDIQERITISADVKDLKPLYEALESTEKLIKRLQYEVDVADDAKEIKGKGELSLIEIWQANQIQRKKDLLRERQLRGEFKEE